MREMLVIAKREFLERVRTKWFVAITLLGPVFMIGLIVIPVLIEGSGGKGAKIDIVDASGKLGAPLAQMLEAGDMHWHVQVVPPATTDAALLDQLKHKEINGFVRVPADAITGGKIVYRGDNATNQNVEVTLRTTISLAVIGARAAEYHLSEDQTKQLMTPADIQMLHSTGETAGESAGAAFMIGYFIAFILYMVITLYGVNVMRSVVIEKSSRVVELLISATKPRAMMAGKILGVGGAGLLQVAIWFGIGGIALAYRAQLLGLFGVAGGGSALPPLTLAQILVAIGFFILGYLFYSTMYAAMGATVSNEQDSQQASVPITMLLVIGFVAMTAVTGDPRGSTSMIMTQVPFWSPMLMPLRYVLGAASAGEVAMSLGILAASTVVLSRAAAKIYRVGILMYGKRPNLVELLRWLRY
jgi:ABC-2 type transport system permease protein